MSISNEHRAKFYSPSPAMLVSLYDFFLPKECRYSNDPNFSDQISCSCYEMNHWRETRFYNFCFFFPLILYLISFYSFVKDAVDIGLDSIFLIKMLKSGTHS